MPEEKSITGRYIEGDIWLSRQVIKDILTDDLNNLGLIKRNQAEVKATKDYIDRLIYRLDHMRI
jgi:hypothetical protein